MALLYPLALILYWESSSLIPQTNMPCFCQIAIKQTITVFIPLGFNLSALDRQTKTCLAQPPPPTPPRAELMWARVTQAWHETLHLVYVLNKDPFSSHAGARTAILDWQPLWSEDHRCSSSLRKGRQREREEWEMEAGGVGVEEGDAAEIRCTG